MIASAHENRTAPFALVPFKIRIAVLRKLQVLDYWQCLTGQSNLLVPISLRPAKYTTPHVLSVYAPWSLYDDGGSNKTRLRPTDTTIRPSDNLREAREGARIKLISRARPPSSSSNTPVDSSQYVPE